MAETAPEPHPVALRLQVLTTEHWSLLASRGLAWNESFSRAGMYLSTLSGSLVALGLIAGIDRFGPVFVTFALVALPLVLFVGVGTLLRMGSANYHEALTVLGMNRIRAAYLELAPDLAPYFVMGVHDDAAGVAVTMAMAPTLSPRVHLVSATPFLIQVLNSAVAAAIGAIVIAALLGAGAGPTLVAAGLLFGLVLGAQARFAAGSIRRGRATVRPLFPTPDRASAATGDEVAALGDRP